MANLIPGTERQQDFTPEELENAANYMNKLYKEKHDGLRKKTYAHLEFHKTS